MISYTKINLRRVTDLNLRAKIMKRSEEITKVNLQTLGKAMFFKKPQKWLDFKIKTPLC